MADAQLMEEQLQRSVMRDAEMIQHISDGVVAVGDDGSYASHSHIVVHDGEFDAEGDIDMDTAEEQRQDYDEDEQSESEEEDSGNSNSEEEEDEEEDDDDDDDSFEEDAEGEEDDEVIQRRRLPQRRLASRVTSRHSAEDDDDEGVGAVKFRPGETEDEDSRSESASSASGSDDDSDGDEEWHEADHDDGDDDESADTTGLCIFCKQDEDHDPSEEFEVYLACTRCGDNAHQQCARENEAITSEQGPGNWRCPKCAGMDSDSDAAVEENEATTAMDSAAEPNPSSSRRTSVPKLACDLLPSQKGIIKPDSHSVFNQLVLDEDPMDGSRVLRKRKTSSTEADDGVMTLRKRRKATTDGQSNDEGATNQDDSSRPVSRSLRIKIANAPASIIKNTRGSLIVKFRVNSSELRQILSRKPRGSRKRSTGRSSRRRTSRNDSRRIAALPVAPITTPFTPTAYSQPFYSFFDKETDEMKGKPYGGILSEAEADTSKTMPTNEDRRRFDEAKQKAEEEWRERVLKMQAEMELPPKKSKKASGPASQIECIEFGGWEIDTWYAAPYPEEYSRNRVLYICEFCLKYMNSDYVAWRHKLKCPAKHPPGDEIYRHGSVSVFEVDGRKNPVYCQNLCLLAKLFLGSKTLYYDVEPFLFYVLCEYDELGYHFVGYFSKEKRASSQNNVSCILTLPIHQRKGYGNLLIDFSYLLTRVEKKTGSPEKPLSDMGLVSYRNYWRLVMCRYLLEHFSEEKSGKMGLSIKQISEDTGMTPDDVISALEGLRALVKDPQTQLYALRVDLQYCREYVEKWEAKGYVKLNPNALTWTPYVMGRSNSLNFELAPTLSAIAARDDDEEIKPDPPVEDPLINGSNSPTRREDPPPDIKINFNTTILQSAEKDAMHSAVKGDPKPSESDGADDAPDDQKFNSGPDSKDSEGDDWMLKYKDIPPTRFEPVPPVPGRRSADRSRSVVIPRPPTVRSAGSSTSRPRSRRLTAGSRRSTTSRPRTSGSNSSKRRPGGTGRGPGRWPKGTKKSDYGNADSGPGFPPAWIAERNRLAALAAAKKEAAEKQKEEEATAVGESGEVRDTVQVQSTAVSDQLNGSVAAGSKTPRGKGKGKAKEVPTDVVMGEADAEGEED